MNTIDKIRAEIKKLQDIFVETAQGMETEDEATVYSMCAVEFGDELLSFLDTLETVSDCHDLEDEIKKFIEEYGYERGEDKLLIAIVARHFAEWGAEHLRDSTKKMSEDLEEAADEWCKTNNKGIALCADKKSHYLAEGIDAFIAGAEWQKKQIPMPEDTVIFQKGVEEGKRLMMEGAVEGEVVKDISNKLAATAKNINLDGLKFGDKVRIIIVKKEEK